MGEWMKALAVLLGIIGTCFGGYFYIDKTYAERTQVHKLELRVTANELDDLLRRAQENMYFYREQLRKYPNDVDIIKRLKEAEEEVKELRERLKNLRKRGDGGN